METISKGKVIIIGGGLSGLTAGVYLKKFGYDVEILEKNLNVGGLCTCWTRKGSLIDGCIHWLTESDYGELNDVMKEIGALGDNVPVHHFDTYIQTYVNNKVVKFPMEYDQLQQELLKYAKGNDKKKICTLIKHIKSCRRDLLSPGKPYWNWNVWDKIKFFFRVIPFVPVMKYGQDIDLADFANSLESEELRFFFANTILPRDYSMFSFCYTMGGICAHNSGVPHGGSATFAERIANKFVGLGGVVTTRAEVKRVLVDENTATGVEMMDGSVKNADFIVSACDIFYSLENLFENRFKVKILEDAKQKTKCFKPFSIFLLSFRTDKDLSQLPVHTFYQCEEYEVLGQKEKSLYIKHFSYDDTFVHDGKTLVQYVLETDDIVFERLSKMTPEEYKQFKQDFAAKITDLIGKYGQDNFGELEFLDLVTPLTFPKWTHSYRGSFMTYKLSKKNRQFILRNDVLPLRNVALAGNWLMIPGGVPVAIQQGKFAAHTIEYQREHIDSFDVEKAKKKLDIPLKSIKNENVFTR